MKIDIKIVVIGLILSTLIFVSIVFPVYQDISSKEYSLENTAYGVSAVDIFNKDVELICDNGTVFIDDNSVSVPSSSTILISNCLYLMKDQSGVVSFNILLSGASASYSFDPESSWKIKKDGNLFKIVGYEKNTGTKLDLETDEIDWAYVVSEGGTYKIISNPSETFYLTNLSNLHGIVSSAIFASLWGDKVTVNGVTFNATVFYEEIKGYPGIIQISISQNVESTGYYFEYMNSTYTPHTYVVESKACAPRAEDSPYERYYLVIIIVFCVNLGLLVLYSCSSWEGFFRQLFKSKS